MRRGCLALIDALGFKGIWRHNDPDQVLAKLHDLQQEANRGFEEMAKGADAKMPLKQRPVDVSITFLSDTICIAAACVEQDVDGVAAKVVVDTTAYVIQHALKPPVPLSFRGAITFGEFQLGEEGRFLVGPA